MRFPALRSRDFQLYTGGNLFAMNALWINRVVISWVGWELTGSASWVGLLSFCLFAPTFISSPLFGVLVDRIEQRKTAIVTQSVVALMTATLLTLHVTGTLTIWLLSAIALVIGVTQSADRTVRMTMVPRMVPREALANAVAIHGINFNTARLVGPAIGGVLLDALGTDVTIAINLALFAPMIIALALLKTRGVNSPKSARQRFFVELADGASFAARHPLIREAMMLTGLSAIAARGALEILPVIADGEYGRGAQGLGQLLAASGAGALIAAVIIALTRSRPSTDRLPLSAPISVVVSLIAVVALGAVHNWLAALAAVFVIGFASTTIGIGMQATIQMALEDAYRGRVMSLWIVVGIGGAAVGAILLGALADMFGVSETLIGAGIVAMLLTAAVRLALSGLPPRLPPSPPAGNS